MKKWFDKKFEIRNLKSNSNNIKEDHRKINVNRILRIEDVFIKDDIAVES